MTDREYNGNYLICDLLVESFVIRDPGTVASLDDNQASCRLVREP